MNNQNSRNARAFRYENRNARVPRLRDYVAEAAKAFALIGMLSATPAFAAADRFTVNVAHDLNEARPAEVIVVPWKEVLARLPAARPNHVRVRDAAGREVPSQITNFHPEVR